MTDKRLLNPAPPVSIEQQQITVQDEKNIWIVGGAGWESALFDTDVTRDAPDRKDPVNILLPGGTHLVETNSKIFDIQFTQRIDGGPLPLSTYILYAEGNDFVNPPTPTKHIFSTFSPYREISFRAVFRFVIFQIYNLQPPPNTLIIDDLKIMTRIDG